MKLRSWLGCYNLAATMKRSRNGNNHQALNMMEPILNKIQSYLPPLDERAKTMIVHAFENGPAYREDLLLRWGTIFLRPRCFEERWITGIELSMNHTVLPSAPAEDAISQTQIALNNMMDQVRESYLYLLELAPALDLKGEVIDTPKEQLDKWRAFRSEFEASWRLGEKLSVPTAANINPVQPLEGEEDPKVRAMNDALFRAQRLITIAQCIRQQIGLLPRAVPTPEQIALWKRKNEELNSELSAHVRSITVLSKSVHQCIDNISSLTLP